MPNTSNYIINVKDLTVVYDEKPVLWDLDLQVPAQTMLGIVGPNGSGKTTLLKSILGIIKPITGTISIQNNPSQGHANIAYVPQKNTVDWTFPISVQDVVMMGRYHYLSWYQKPSKQDYEITQWALQQVHMHDLAHRHINELSGGQQQRVFVARALAQQAHILILDEPFNSIDMVTQQIILQLLNQLKQQGTTILVVHHDLNTVQNYFEWTFLMNIKHIALGPTQQVLTPDNIIKTFNTPFHFNVTL
ncbi:metal ABC transporter ATP-binding protein [Candidatus Babeliales bacterium]|nr:metal ABC transporter ATP-binding protein [Candidatus Babeliales bacterium]